MVRSPVWQPCVTDNFSLGINDSKSRGRKVCIQFTYKTLPPFRKSLLAPGRFTQEGCLVKLLKIIPLRNQHVWVDLILEFTTFVELHDIGNYQFNKI